MCFGWFDCVLVGGGDGACKIWPQLTEKKKLPLKTNEQTPPPKKRVVGEQAESYWLYNVPWSISRMLSYVDKVRCCCWGVVFV